MTPTDIDKAITGMGRDALIAALKQAHADFDAAVENLTAVQKRCNELLEENRCLRDRHQLEASDICTVLLDMSQGWRARLARAKAVLRYYAESNGSPPGKMAAECLKEIET